VLVNGISSGGAIGLLFFGALTYWAWQRHKIVEYSLYLTTSSSEAQALATRDESQVLELRDALETAIARQHERLVHVHHDVAPHPAGTDAGGKNAYPANIRHRLLR